MEVIVVSLTILFAILTIITRQVITSSFYFLLTCLGVACCFFQINIIPLTLILIFSTSLWGITYFLLSTVSPDKVSSAFSEFKRKDLVLICALLFGVLILLGLLIKTLINDPKGTLLTGDFFEYIKFQYIQNFPLLLLMSLLLVGALAAAVFLTNKFKQGDEQ